jgi:hypothetical protein
MLNRHKRGGGNMITILKTGSYRLVETKWGNKILSLDDRSYAWIDSKRVGELLVTTHREHSTSFVLSRGAYILYDVKDEEYLTDLQHLELECGIYAWQGYLLLTGLPDDDKKSRIIPTEQLITGVPSFAPRYGQHAKAPMRRLATSRR